MSKCPVCDTEYCGKLHMEAAAIPDRQEPIPIGYVMRSNKDGSIGCDIAPVGWSTFESQFEKIKNHAWVKAGIASIAPLYDHPAADAIANLQAQLAEQESYPGIAHDFETAKARITELEASLFLCEVANKNAQLWEKEARELLTEAIYFGYSVPTNRKVAIKLRKFLERKP